MAGLSIGDAVGAGFGLIRRRPASVLVWGLVQTALAALSFAISASSFANLFSQFAAGAGGAPPVSAVSAAGMRVQGVSLLLNIVTFFVVTVLNCGVFRSLIHPEQRRFAFLRVGATELILYLVLVGFCIVFVIAFIVAMIPAAIVIGVLAGLHALVAAVIVGIILGAVGMWAFGYVGLRLSMIGPMTVDRGGLRLMEAWALTKGRTWRLFLIAVCVFGILLAAELVLMAVAALAFLGVLGGLPGGLPALPVLMQQPSILLSRLAPLLAVGAVVAIPLYGAVLAIMAAPWAQAYLDLHLDPSEAF